MLIKCCYVSCVFTIRQHEFEAVGWCHQVTRLNVPQNLFRPNQLFVHVYINFSCSVLNSKENRFSVSIKVPCFNQQLNGFLSLRRNKLPLTQMKQLVTLPLKRWPILENQGIDLSKTDLCSCNRNLEIYFYVISKGYHFKIETWQDTTLLQMVFWIFWHKQAKKAIPNFANDFTFERVASLFLCNFKWYFEPLPPFHFEMHLPWNSQLIECLNQQRHDTN